ncbi:hypothetical protein VMCG_10927 [Cytospora schulzeri]|uniref:Uncharacterized protein n=1 Tax=Cytospora schulzeri TaxID=448051 RepID=A0A423V7X0_9PEZI|nr:hypothetical protein VMCG_10927 [Valsa malicola]
MDPVDDDARFFVEEVLDDDPLAGVSESTVKHCSDQDARDGEARYDNMSLQARSNTSISTQECSLAGYTLGNVATIDGSSMMSLDRKMGTTTTTSTTINNNDNSHNSVNITNIYHQQQAYVEDEEEGTRRPGSQPQGTIVETIWGETGGTSMKSHSSSMLSTTADNHHHHHHHNYQQQSPGLQPWLTFPTWAIRLTLWLLKSLQAPIIWVSRLCLGIVLQGVAAILLLLVISLVGFWALKWWWMQIWSLPYTAAAGAAASPLSTAYTSIWLWLGYAIENLPHPFYQATWSSFSSPSDYHNNSSTAANTAQTDTNSATTKTLSSVALTISSAVLWGDGYTRLASSVISQCDLQASAFAGPLATARSELPRAKEIHRSAVDLKDRINAQLAREAQRARRLERKLRQASLQTMLKNQEAEARKAYNTHVAALRPSPLIRLRRLLYWAWQCLWPTTLVVEPGSTTRLNKLKTHSIVGKWLEEGMGYMEYVRKARLEWQSDYNGIVDDESMQRLETAWCDISKTSTEQRQKDWKEGVSDQEKDGNSDKGLENQLADIESTSRLACLAHGSIANDLQQRLSKLENNAEWLSGRMKQMENGPLAILKDHSSLSGSGKDSGGGGGGDDDGGNEADYLSRMLLAADDLQAIRDFLTDTLVLQEQFNRETFDVKTSEAVP